MISPVNMNPGKGFYGLNVLIYPAGSELGLEVYDALKFTPHVKLFTANAVFDFSSIESGNHYFLPSAYEGTFFEALKNFVSEYSIDVIFPTHDAVVERLAEGKELFNADVINADKVTASICRSKISTYSLFKRHSWCPTFETNAGNVKDFPVVAKPDKGHGGKGVFLIEDSPCLEAFSFNLNESYVYVEYLPGEEVTVDCFTDFNGALIVSEARYRKRCLGSISASSNFFEESEIKSIARDINDNLEFRGGWYFQLKKDKHDGWKLLEVASRLSSSSVFQRIRGINLPLLSIHDYMNKRVAVKPLSKCVIGERRLRTKARINMKYDKIYLDLDDTLVVHGKVNHELMSFIYQSVNLGKKVFLVTRHQHDVFETLDKYKISPKLFCEIYAINNLDEKSFFVTQDSIFIDNHYLERELVFGALDIPCFDADSATYL